MVKIKVVCATNINASGMQVLGTFLECLSYVVVNKINYVILFHNQFKILSKFYKTILLYK